MPETVLVCGPNWLGDSVMSMPAVQALRRQWAGARLVMLVKRGLVPLWQLHAAADGVIALEEGPAGTRRTARAVRSAGVSRAYVFPNSWRSALIPLLAGVPERIGTRGHNRAWMLTRVVDLAPSPARHQAWEYLTMAGDAGALEAPHLPVPADVTTETAKRFGIDAGETWIGLFPGAARGPSKRWPADSFAEAGRVLGQRTGHRIAVFGTRSDCAVCDRVAGGIAGACNLAGATSLRDLAALLQICRVVLCNDSGGMHLAAAVGTSVVAVFGATDPAKTGPLGRRHRVLAAERVVRSREIPRRSARAQRALEAIGPSRVVNAALEILTEPAGGRVEGAA